MCIFLIKCLLFALFLLRKVILKELAQCVNLVIFALKSGESSSLS